MASSPTDICNLALAHLGESRIESLDEDNVASRACSMHYAFTRDEVLRSHRWNFAVKRAVLSRLEEDPPFGYAAQYELPADCLRVLEVNGSELGDVLCGPYVIEGRRLLTDAAAVNLLFIRRAADVSQFDALFAQALALKLAVALSETIRGTTGKTAELMAAYERTVAPLARRVDANEGRRRKGLLPLNSPFVRMRMASDVLTVLSAGAGASGVQNTETIRRAGTRDIATGESSVTVAFPTAFATDAWGFAGPLVIVNTTDLSPLNLMCGTVTARHAGGFTVLLSGATDSPNYELQYRCEL
jgi:hypothetical protein